MVNFNDAINLLVDIGFMRVIAPFIFVFAIVYGILQKAKIFHGGANDDKSAKQINATLSFVIALFATISVNVFNFMQSAFAIAAMSIVVILCMLIILGLLLGEQYTKIFEDDRVKYGLAIVVFLVALGFILVLTGIWDWFGNQFSRSGFSFGLGISGDTIGFVIVFAIIVAAVYWITRSEPGSGS